MKRWKLVRIIASYVFHDPYAYDPKYKWIALPPEINANYSIIRPVLLHWQDEGYITLIEDEEYIFKIHPEKITFSMREIIEESKKI